MEEKKRKREAYLPQVQVPVVQKPEIVELPHVDIEEEEDYLEEEIQWIMRNDEEK